MKAWTRWQDWVAVAAGLYAVLAVIWITPRDTVTVTLMSVFGGLLIIAALAGLAMPKSAMLESAAAVMAALLFVSPWLGGYESTASPAWTSWATGIVGLAAALWALEPAIQLHRSTGGTVHSHA